LARQPEGPEIVRGPHDRTQHAALLYALHERRRSGILEVRNDQLHRRIFLLGGTPIWCESNLEEEALAQTIVASGLVPCSIASAILDDLAPDADAVEAVLGADLLTEEVLEVHLAQRVERGFAAGLAWDQGEWTFEAHPRLRPSAVDPALRLEVATVRALWSGACWHLPADAAELEPFSRGDGAVQHEERFDRIFPVLCVDPGLEDLSRMVRLGPSVDKLHGLFRERGADLARLLWLLHAIGALAVEGLESPVVDLPSADGEAIPAEVHVGTADSSERLSYDIYVEEDSEPGDDGGGS